MLSSELKLPPQNLIAERSVIGSILLDNKAYDDVCEKLRPSHFYLDIHQETFETICSILDRGARVDATILAEALDAKGVLEEFGGIGFVMDLMEVVAFSHHAEYYADIVIDNCELRELQNACQSTLRVIDGAEGDRDEALESHERSLAKLIDMRQDGSKDTSIASIVQEAFEAIEERVAHPERVPGLPSGFKNLDVMTNGFHPGQLIILAARPSMGKTAMVCNLADWFAGPQQATTLLFSLEQSRQELAERFLAINSRVDGHAIRRGVMPAPDLHAVKEAKSDIASRYRLHIDDTASRTIAQMRSIARRVKRKDGLGCIIVDYLQLAEPEDKKANREVQVAQIARRLKGLAKDMGVPVIALSQLNRGVELREDKRPRLADLRESGAIEQDADIVMFLHRPDAYVPEDRPGLAELIVAKHRSGPIGIVELKWEKTNMRFQDWVPVQPAEEQF